MCVEQVRAAAYTALARYPFETLELLELARPLQQYSRLLLQERDESALAACEGLVTAALSHEHARRRRCHLPYQVYIRLEVLYMVSAT